MTIKVHHIRDESLNYETVAFIDDETGDTLEVQRSLVADEQDRATGMDTYCLSNSSGAAHYGGIMSWELRNGQLRLELSSEAAVSLGVQTVLLIDVGDDFRPIVPILNRLLRT